MRPPPPSAPITLTLLLACASITAPGAHGQSTGEVVATVHNVFTIADTMANWEADHPDLVERFRLGTSVNGLPIDGIVVTDESVAGPASGLSTGEKLRIYLDGGHHGNEYLGTEILMEYVDTILAGAATGDEHAVRLLRENEIHVVPLLNPEGNLGDRRYNGRLVDLNRNYDIGWSPCQTPPVCLAGTAPRSEPEVAANVAYVEALDPDLWISTHTGIETLFWPQGDASVPGDPFVPYAPDIGMFETMEVGFEAATNGRIDAYGGPAPAVGSAEDFGYGAYGIPTYVYEVHNDQNLIAYEEPMSDLLAEQLAGLHFLVDHARHQGAWVEAARDETGWRLANEGWGPARNITITTATGTTVVPEIGPGASAAIAGDPVSWSYPALLIETSRMRTHGLESTDAEATPLALWPAVTLVGLAWALRRR